MMDSNRLIEGSLEVYQRPQNSVNQTDQGTDAPFTLGTLRPWLQFWIPYT